MYFSKEFILGFVMKSIPDIINRDNNYMKQALPDILQKMDLVPFGNELLK